MRYFYYGKDTQERDEKKELQNSVTEAKRYIRDRDLVIEEDTIYEVDRICMYRRFGKK